MVQGNENLGFWRRAVKAMMEGGDCDGSQDSSSCDRPSCEGSAGDLGRVRVRKGSRDDLGGCNFCDDRCSHVIYELSGARLCVRLCPSCLKVVKGAR